MYLRRFAPYFRLLKPVRVQFGIGLLAGMVYAASSGFGLPFIINHLVPQITGENAPEGLALLGMLLLVPGIFLLRSAGTFVNGYFIAYTGLYILEQIRRMVFDRLQHLPLAFFQKNRGGDLLSRISGDSQQLQTAIVRVVDSLIKEPATLLSAAVYLVYLSFVESDVTFLLIALVSVPVCVLPIRFIGKRILDKAGKAQSQAGQLNEVVRENLAAAREVRAYNLQKRESERFGQACRDFLKKSLKVVKYDKSLSPLIEFVTSVAILGALYAAIVRDIPEGALASILAALYMCYQPVKRLGKVSNIIRRAEASLNRLEYILHSEDNVPDPENPAPLGSIRGRIEFRNVCFRYSPEDPPALREINTTLEAGQSIALVGPSGAGKTTFANLVPRFYDPTSGTVAIDGTDLRTVSKQDLRSRIALVSQEALLFNDTIANNIRLSRPGAGDGEVRAAARAANADRFIEALEHGYETIVGEQGSRLSGGQRQRISIARAFLKEAAIIILDEPTSALDAESEYQIQSALEELSRGRTVLIIAHRFSTIQHADTILVFHEGAIIDSGRHKELYARNELYRNLYQKQAKTILTEAAAGN